MSTTSLPSYTPPVRNRVPSYTYEPLAHEQRLALADRTRLRPSGEYVQNSKNGHISLRLLAQENDATQPVYGSGGLVDGVVDISKTEGVTRVEVKIEGNLKIREIGEGGHVSVKLCLDNKVLWFKERENVNCAPSLPFSLRLPETFTFEDKTYPLPPTHGVKLSGFPGFTANIDYSVSVLINKPAAAALGSKAIGLIVGATVNTPFVYYPRTRPQYGIPPPLYTDNFGFFVTPEWTSFESSIPGRQPGIQDITTKLCIPSSRTFCMSDTIPFHLSLHSTSMSLAAFLPLSPTAKVLGGRKPTQVQIMRQSTVDVRNLEKVDLRQDIWRVDCIGEGDIQLTADAASWIAYSGEIRINPDVKVAGFKAAGLSVKDCILFTVNPTDATKSPFGDLRQVISIKLTTDPWAHPNGAGIGNISVHSTGSSET